MTVDDVQSCGEEMVVEAAAKDASGDGDVVAVELAEKHSARSSASFLSSIGDPGVACQEEPEEVEKPRPPSMAFPPKPIDVSETTQQEEAPTATTPHAWLNGATFKSSRFQGKPLLRKISTAGALSEIVVTNIRRVQSDVRSPSESSRLRRMIEERSPKNAPNRRFFIPGWASLFNRSAPRSPRCHASTIDYLNKEGLMFETARRNKLMKAEELEEKAANRCWAVASFVKNPRFEAFFAFLILANVLVMAAEAQYVGMETGAKVRYNGATEGAEEVWPGARSVFTALELILGSLFTLEVCLKGFAMPSSFCTDYWMGLDVVIVGFWLISAMSSTLMPIDPMLLRLARFARLLRMLRLVRKVHSFESLYLLTTSLKASIATLAWSFFLLFLVQMAIALLLCYMLEVYIQDSRNPKDDRDLLYKYYGTFSRAIFSVFEMAIGNWPDSSRILTENVNEWYVLFVLAYQCVVGFAVVRVIMGVFLRVTFDVASTDDILMLNQKERAIRTHSSKIRALFKAADEDGSGYLDRREFLALVEDEVVTNWLAAMECNVSLFANDGDILYTLVDNGDEQLTVEELVRGVAGMKGPARSIDLAVLIYENRRTCRLLEELCEKINIKPGDSPRFSTNSMKFGMRGSIGKSERSLGRMRFSGSVTSSIASLRSLQEGDADASTMAGTSEAHFTPKSGRTQATRFSSHSASRRSFKGSPKAAVPRLISIGSSLFLSTTLPKSYQRGWAHKLLESWSFEAFFSAVTLLSSLVLAVEAQYHGIDVGFALGYPGSDRSAPDAWPGAQIAFTVLETFFGTLFFLEVALKVFALRWMWVKHVWNWFDAAIVLFWLAGLLSHALPVDSLFLRLTRPARLLRLVRLFRVIEGFDALYLMTTSIKGSFKALPGSAALLFLLEAMLVASLNQVLALYMEDENEPLDKRQTIYRYFGTFSKGLLSVLELSLANWAPISRTLSENVNEWYTLFALAHKLTMGFSVISVVTGVLLQETFSVAMTDDAVMMRKEERTTRLHKTKMLRLFTEADMDGNGYVDRDEFLKVVKDPTVRTWLASMGIDVGDADAVFTLVEYTEAQGRGAISLDELIRGIARLKGTAMNMNMLIALQEQKRLKAMVQQLQQHVREQLLKEYPDVDEGCSKRVTDPHPHF